MSFYLSLVLIVACLMCDGHWGFSYLFLMLARSPALFMTCDFRLVVGELWTGACRGLRKREREGKSAKSSVARFPVSHFSIPFQTDALFLRPLLLYSSSCLLVLLIGARPAHHSIHSFSSSALCVVLVCVSVCVYVCVCVCRCPFVYVSLLAPCAIICP